MNWSSEHKDCPEVKGIYFYLFIYDFIYYNKLIKDQ